MQQQYQEIKAKEAADKQAAQEEKDRVAAEKSAQKAESEANRQAQQEESQPSDNQADSSDSSAVPSDSSSSDFSAAISDTVAELMNTDYYPYVQDVSFSVDPDDKNITMMAVLNSSTNKRTALDFADTMIRRFSSNVVAHDGDYSMPSKNYYGSLFDTYKITIGVAPSSATDNPGRWYYSKVIYPGNHTQQGPHIK
jgi:flagellar biosynthesis GTPase FlhF